MKKFNNYLILFALAALSFYCSCKKKENDIAETPSNPVYGKGIYISCEGPFQTGTGTISYYNPQSKMLVNEVFMKENGRPLGNIVQSITIFNGKVYAVVNNAAKVEVADASTFKSVGVINGLTSPRYFIGHNSNKGYISDWSNNVKVINLQNNSITKSIATGGKGPERMLLSGNLLFVLNAGGWDIDNLLTVINTGTDMISDTVRIGDRPGGIVKDKDNMIWIICSGKGFNNWPQADDTKGRLICINPINMQIVHSFEFSATDIHPECLAIHPDGDKLYYLYQGGIFEMSIHANSLPNSPLISSSRSFYALGFDGVSMNIVVSDPLDYSQNGWVIMYNPQSTLAVDSFKVGIIPGNFCFMK
jgi:hypothetical protein